MKIVDCEQGSTAWFLARNSRVTASEFDALVTPLFKKRESAGVETYMFRKLAEKVMGWSAAAVSGYAMDQGQILERSAIPWYEFQNNVNVKRVGFCVSDDGRTGCSPDGLLPDGTGLEIKSPQTPTALKYLLAGVLPPEYRAQIHFSLFVTGAPRWMFVSYHNHLPKLERFDAAFATIQKLREAA